MKLNLEGKNALITAASYGLGFFCAEALAREKASVAICSRDPKRITDAANSIALTTGSKAHAIPGDLTVESDIARIIQEAEDALGTIDILVLSTGHPPTYPFSQATDAHWQRGIDLILKPAIALSRAVIPKMKAQGYGRLVFIGSIFGLEPERSSIVQSTLRTGLNSFSKCIASEFAADGITSNVICPGYFDTPLVRDLAKKYALETNTSVEAVLDDWRTFAPVKKFGKPEDLGDLVAFIASPRGEFINGTSITIDGGALRQY
jgi:3-oxoacyl-[acyl-carrier protein] reductase